MSDLRPEAILRSITNDPMIREDDWTIVIMGRGGPTGKTWLCDRLKERDYRAVEIAESVNFFVEYGDKNHFITDPYNKTTTVILNRKLEMDTISKFDRATALAVLKDLSINMYPSYDLYGRKTLVIDRKDFEAVRKKYLDKHGEDE